MIEVVRYTQDKACEWNDFVARSKNGTFLFDRRYMDYHANRFQDNSYMVYRKDCLFALFPANAVADTIYSHQGLSYGGLITSLRATAETVCDAFAALGNVLRHEGFRKMVYKPVPHIYHKMPAEEDVYALFFRCSAQLVGRDVSSTILLKNKPKFEESRRSGLRKAQRLGLTVAESEDLVAFWHILEENLRQKYDSKPVHSLDEIRLLKSRFPNEIRLFMVCENTRPLGGTILYLTPQVVHTQYISASPEGKQKGAIDLLFDHLIHHNQWSQDYFDFGTSAQDHSCEIKSPLMFQKLGFGARAVCYDTYEWRL